MKTIEVFAMLHKPRNFDSLDHRTVSGTHHDFASGEIIDVSFDNAVTLTFFLPLFSLRMMTTRNFLPHFFFFLLSSFLFRPFTQHNHTARLFRFFPA